MSNPRLIPIDSLIRRSDARQTSEEDLTALESSIAEVGLLNPITVRAMPDGMFEIIAGSHRYTVCDGLGHHEILCHVVEMDDLRAELAMIDENLCRAELSGILLDKQTARRKEIYEELHPETRHSANASGAASMRWDHASRQLGDTHTGSLPDRAEAGKADRFTAETAALTGRSERSVQRSAERGAKVSEEAAQLMRGTRLDTGTYADRIKDMPTAEQAEKVRRDLTEPPRPASAPAPKPAPAPAAANPNAYNRFIELADEVETLRIAELIASAGRQRSTLGQRASGLADMMSDIMEGLNR